MRWLMCMLFSLTVSHHMRSSWTPFLMCGGLVVRQQQDLHVSLISVWSTQGGQLLDDMATSGVVVPWPASRYGDHL